MSNRGREWRGRVAELKAMATAAARGWEISLPWHMLTQKYDISLNRGDGEGWIKIQIKRGWYDKKISQYKVDLRRTKKEHYQSEDIDAFFVWGPDENHWWLIPYDVVCDKGQITLKGKYDQFLLGDEVVD